MRVRIQVIITAALLVSAAMALAQKTGETKQAFEARTKWWREAKFGMFIHWGVYAVPAAGEWYMYGHQVQVKDYEKYAPQFNPTRFDAKQWVNTARNAGMKYIVITSKHHDGFCMFDSKLTDYTIVRATPFKRDPLKELAKECDRQGIRLCFYHSIMDWHHPDYLPRRPWEKDIRPADGADLNRYIDHMKGQLRELLTGYGPIGVIWFDGGWEHNAEELRSKEVNAMIRSLQPKILINDRNQLPEDFSTPEQTIPAGALPGDRLWETCMTINDNWGFAKDDHNWKSAEDLIHKLCDIASKGGNFLLNVGPTPGGTFPEPITARLARVGKWMKVNGKSIYATSKSPFRRLPFDGRCTSKGNRLFLQVFRWPEEGLTLSGLQTPVKMARALDGNQKLEATTQLSADGETITHIGKPKRIDPAATVVELRFAAPPVITETPLTIKPEKDGTFSLKAVDAKIHGETARYEQGGGKDNIGYWTKDSDYVTWLCQAPVEGKYQVEVDYACPPENAGSHFTVGPEGGTTVDGSVKATGSWTAFQTERLGEITLSAGKQTIAGHVTEMPRGAVMNLRMIMLRPVK